MVNIKAYATTEDYTAWLNGRTGTIPLAEFPFWAARARERIDFFTLNRLHYEFILEEYKQDVINTTCELAEILYSVGITGEKKLTSMSIGGYSESYDKEAAQSNIDNVIRRGLGLTGLLYRGR